MRDNWKERLRWYCFSKCIEETLKEVSKCEDNCGNKKIYKVAKLRDLEKLWEAKPLGKLYRFKIPPSKI